MAHFWIWCYWRHIEVYIAGLTVKSYGTYFSGQILQNSGRIDGSCCTNSSVTGRTVFQVSVDTAYGELQTRERKTYWKWKKNEGLWYGAKNGMSKIFVLRRRGKENFNAKIITWSPARADRDTAFAFVFPESLPALPPA